MSICTRRHHRTNLLLAPRQPPGHGGHGHCHRHHAGAAGRAGLRLTALLIVVGLGVGGAIGAYIARRIPMTSMPELVAAFHSLVGLAAVFVAAGALYAPEAFHIGTPGNIAAASLIEMSLGVAIGAVTFTGSVIAFAKLSGRMSGKPITLPARHLINLALAVLLVALISGFCLSGGDPGCSGPSRRRRCCSAS